MSLLCMGLHRAQEQAPASPAANWAPQWNSGPTSAFSVMDLSCCSFQFDFFRTGLFQGQFQLPYAAAIALE